MSVTRGSQGQKLTVRSGGSGLVLGLIAIAAITRMAAPSMVDSAWNFAPVSAIALFGGAYFTSRLAGVLVPLLALLISDIFVNGMVLGTFSPLYEGCYWQYIAYAIISGLGILLRDRIRPSTVLGASVTSSLVFFLVTNFGVWASTELYPKTVEGLLLCFTMAIPFFGNTFVGDLFFAALMFGSCEWALRKAEQPARVAVH